MVPVAPRGILATPHGNTIEAGNDRHPRHCPQHQRGQIIVNIVPGRQRQQHIGRALCPIAHMIACCQGVPMLQGVIPHQEQYPQEMCTKKNAPDFETLLVGV